MVVCHYHPDRPGIGVCMRCRRVICAACSTKMDGVNHCHACLKAIGARGSASSAGASAALTAVVLLCIGGGFCFGLGWLMQSWLAP
jgi:hypothetical protein